MSAMNPVILLLVVIPYCVCYVFGINYAVGFRSWMIAALYIVWAGEACWRALPAREERKVLIAFLLAPWSMAFLLAMANAGTGGYRQYASEYVAITGSCGVAAVQCGLTAGYNLWKEEVTRPTAHCLLVALFCGAGSAINGWSRWIYTSPDPLAAWRILSGVDAGVGCVVMLGIIWMQWRRKA